MALVQVGLFTSQEHFKYARKRSLKEKTSELFFIILRSISGLPLFKIHYLWHEYWCMKDG